MESTDALAQTPLFRHLDAKGVEKLMAGGNIRRLARGEWLVRPGEIWPYLFFVLDGEVIAVKESAEGRILVLTTLQAGDVFWGLALFIPGAPMPAGLRAERDAEILFWERDFILSFLLEDGRMSWNLACMIIGRVQLASEIVEQLAFQPVAGRLARLLAETSGETGPVARSLTLDEMAARIGTTREMVCRFLHRFSDEGLIDITRTEFAIKDRAGLEAMTRLGRG